MKPCINCNLSSLKKIVANRFKFHYITITCLLLAGCIGKPIEIIQEQYVNDLTFGTGISGDSLITGNWNPAVYTRKTPRDTILVFFSLESRVDMGGDSIEIDVTKLLYGSIPTTTTRYIFKVPQGNKHIFLSTFTIRDEGGRYRAYALFYKSQAFIDSANFDIENLYKSRE
jgi:hypothetical protein